ncbi:MAG TPA: ABC transporter permease [Fervidobacterium sp.]|nr:ABC transporter permease [Fervidobacterium sp.]
MKNHLVLFVSLFKQLFLRSKESVFWLAIFPIVLFLILTAIFGNMDENVQFRVKILGESKTLEKILSDIEQMDAEFIADYSQETIDTLKKNIEEDKLDTLVVLPEDFDRNYSSALLLRRTLLFRQVPVELHYAPVRQSSALAFDVVKGIFNSMDVVESVKYEVHNLSQEQYDYNNFIYPGVVGMAIMSVFLFGFMNELVYFRRKGTFKKLSTTPTKMVTIYITAAIVNIISMILSLFVLSLVAYFLGVDVITYLPSTLIHTLLSCAVLTMLTLAIMTFSNNPTGLFIFQQVFLQIQMFLGGFYFPLKMFSPFITKLANLLPLTYTVDGMRVVKGLNSFEYNHFTVPLIYLAVSILIVLMRAKKLGVSE